MKRRSLGTPLTRSRPRRIDGDLSVVTIPVVEVRGAPFRFRVHVYRWPAGNRRRWRIEVLLRVINSRTGKPGYVSFTTDVERPGGKRGEYAPPPARDTVVREARALMQRALAHELDECLYADGVRVTDPHARRRRGRP